MTWIKYIFIFAILNIATAYLELPPTPPHKTVLDQQLFKDVLDPELCQEQMTYLLNNNTMLLARFLDAGYRTPRGLLDFNFRDFGNYYQCLGITQETGASTIQGKYCAVTVPLNQEINFPVLGSDFLNLNTALNTTAPKWRPDSMSGNSETDTEYHKMLNLTMRLNSIERSASDNILFQILTFQVAICLPQSCTTQQFLENVFPLSAALQYQESYCRLPNDKQWVAADYVAIVIFTLLGLLVGMSTTYEVCSIFVFQKDPKSLNKLGISFSVLTNSRRLVTYVPVPGTIECLDGIRSIAILWVIVGHTVSNQLVFPFSNVMDVGEFMQSVEGIWITMAPITVDTFFVLSGLLLVYTTVGKMTPMNLLKNLHLFYLNRLLRMFPLLAAFILIQVSFLSKVADGPHWDLVIEHTETCRSTWWATLLHIQNWVYPNDICLGQTWYLAIDVQLYILSPIVLFWVLGTRKTTAWIALVGALLAVLTGATVFNFIMNFQAWLAVPNRPFEDSDKYMRLYYYNTLTRASPFFIGMIFGYLLHLKRGKRVMMSEILVCLFWILSCAVFIAAGYLTYMVMQADWANQTVDNILNSFKRPVWAVAIGWLVFACQQGYAGPVNWFLSLRFWKVPSRLSYGLYIVHHTLIFLVDSTSLTPGYFDIGASIFKFFADLGLALIVAYILTLLVDAPVSNIIKQFLGSPKKQQPKLIVEDSKQNGNTDLNSGVENGGIEEYNGK